jgi:hypothetical protein
MWIDPPGYFCRQPGLPDVKFAFTNYGVSLGLQAAGAWEDRVERLKAFFGTYRSGDEYDQWRKKAGGTPAVPVCPGGRICRDLSFDPATCLLVFFFLSSSSGDRSPPSHESRILPRSGQTGSAGVPAGLS